VKLRITTPTAVVVELDNVLHLRAEEAGAVDQRHLSRAARRAGEIEQDAQIALTRPARAAQFRDHAAPDSPVRHARH
jgi:hypothetical protein